MLWSVARKKDHYRLALLKVVTGLFVMAGIGAEGAAKRLPRALRNRILSVLRPAESAARRLIDLEARALEPVAYTAPAKRGQGTGTGIKRGPRAPRFRLIDPRRICPGLHPNRRLRRVVKQRSDEAYIQVRVAGFDGAPDFVIWSGPKTASAPEDNVSVERLSRRLLALKAALEDLPAQAKRYVREVAKRRAAPPGAGSMPPLRMGLPPGYRKRHMHPVDAILRECHCLARREPGPPERCAIPVCVATSGLSAADS